MDYTIYFNNKTFDLKSYSFNIKKMFRNCDELVDAEDMKFYKAKYDLINEALGKEQCEELLPNWKEADPNRIDMLFILIFNEYNRPIDEQRAEETRNKIDDLNLEKLNPFVEAVKSVDKIK